jgi:hypothetical protein
MSVNVFEADVRQDLDIFVDLLNRNRDHDVERKRFEWLYLNNPHGRARAWIVKDEKADQAVAFTCVLPRFMYIDGEKTLCWNCGDFSVDKKFRTLGIALKLRRKAKDSVDSGEIAAFYAHPNDRMKVIHQKVGHYELGTMQRYVKLLRVDRHLEKKVNNRLVTGFFSAVINLGLKVRYFRYPKGNFDVRFEGHQKFDSEYDGLFQDVMRKFGVIGDRSALYLNWRYYQNPLYKTERVVLRKDGRLCGYVIFYIENGIAIFKDILCVNHDEALQTLLNAWIEMLRKRKIYSISAIIMDSNPVLFCFKKAGFVTRPETSSVFAYAQQKNPIAEKWLNKDQWYMTVGDRDV